MQPTFSEPSWRPDRFEHEFLGAEVSFKYPTVKLLDYNDRWGELEALALVNAFAVVVMAHLKARATRKDKSSRLSSGRSLSVLEKAAPEDLERWADRILEAKSLDEVFAAP